MAFSIWCGWGGHALDDLKRLYPAILLGITSRSGSVRPYGAEMRLKLLDFDRERQMEAAALQHGAEGQQLLIRARAKANLRPLLRIPLFLTAILAQAAAGRLPDDRESAIAQLIEVAKGTDKIRDAMRTALDGQQQALLEDLAWELMVRGNTAIGEADTVQILADSLNRLRSDRKLFAPSPRPKHSTSCSRTRSSPQRASRGRAASAFRTSCSRNGSPPTRSTR